MMSEKKGLSARNLILLWTLGLAGQLCWNMENQWFNMYVYKYFGYRQGTTIITGMVIFSALSTAFSTFLFGTVSDRAGKRKPLIAFGYIVWGIFTFLFGMTHRLNGLLPAGLMVSVVVLADCIMSFTGSIGNDSGFNAWTTDILTASTRKQIGAAIAVQPVAGTIVGTVAGGMIVDVWGYTGLFAVMGALISLFGIYALLFMRDEPSLRSRKEGSFWQQFAGAFNFRKFFANRELVLVFLTMAVYFIGFNCFFSYIGNIFVYNYGFGEGSFGYLEGIALMLGIVLMLIFTGRFKKDRSPFIILVAVIASIAGLMIMTAVTGLKIYDPVDLVSPDNLLLFIGVTVVGFGYVCFMQTIMTWGKELYPEGQRGQYEGIKIIAFVLIPMIFGSLLAKLFITRFGEIKDYIDSASGVLIRGEKVPNEALFLAASAVMLLSLLPLRRVSKLHAERMQRRQA